jgi:hypothetical protein
MFLRHLSSFVPRASNHVLASRVSSISTRSTQTTFLAYQAASAARFYGKYRPSLQQEEVARNYARHKQELKMAKKVLQLRQSPEKAASVMRQAMAAEWTDPKKTRVLLLKLAKLKHVDAMVKVGNALWFGEFGFEVDKQRGQGFMQDAADMGDRDAKQYVKEYMKEAAWEAAWDHKDKLRREAQERGELADAGEEGVSEEGLELQVRALMTGEQERVAGLNVKELKAELKALEAPVSGAKPDLSDRLLQVLHSSHKRALYAKILDGQDVSESVEHGELEEGSESESDGEYYYSSEGEDSDMDDFMFTNAGEDGVSVLLCVCMPPAYKNAHCLMHTYISTCILSCVCVCVCECRGGGRGYDGATPRGRRRRGQRDLGRRASAGAAPCRRCV